MNSGYIGGRANFAEGDLARSGLSPFRICSVSWHGAFHRARRSLGVKMGAGALSDLVEPGLDEVGAS
jgi:hypothetical protein